MIHVGRQGGSSRSGGQAARPAAVFVIATLVAIVALTLQAASPSFLWKVTGPRGGTVFLAGSLHLLTSEYYPLAPAFDDAFAQSDLLVEELDLAEMEAPAAQLLMLTRGMMPAGQTLDTVITPQTLAEVRAVVTELGLPLAPLLLFKPWSLALTLQGMAWQKAGFDPDLGFDKHFYDRARQRQVAVQGLETLAFQIGQFDGLDMPLQDRLLSETLRELATTSDTVDDLAKAWKAGDVAAIERLTLQDLKSEPQLHQRLLLDRNRAWMPQIEALFSRPKAALVVVGAAHLVGSDGLIAQLRARGYTIAQL